MTTIQIKRGTNAQVLAYTPAAGELVLDTTNKILRIGDGSTAGGTIVGPKTLADLGGVAAANAALTGVPTAPTASAGTNSTQIATTAFVIAQITASLSSATIDGGTLS